MKVKRDDMRHSSLGKCTGLKLASGERINTNVNHTSASNMNHMQDKVASNCKQSKLKDHGI
jgi:hypothetical protein